jgi:Stress responsive A/B Barrel Domain
MMKIIFTLGLAVSFVMIGALVAGAQSKTEARVLRHVVLFKFKDTATPEDVKKVEAAFAELPSKLSVIKGYEWGTNNSPENLNQGLTHCFLLTFSSEKDRDAYLVHPDHKAFGKILGPHLDKATVVDYWTEK